MAIKKLIKKGDTMFYLMQMGGHEIDLFKGTFDSKRKMVPLSKMLKAFPPEVIAEFDPEKTTVNVISLVTEKNQVEIVEI